MAATCGRRALVIARDVAISKSRNPKECEEELCSRLDSGQHGHRRALAIVHPNVVRSYDLAAGRLHVRSTDLQLGPPGQLKIGSEGSRSMTQGETPKAA